MRGELLISRVPIDGAQKHRFLAVRARDQKGAGGACL
jgi:hypothetical protein